MQDTNNMTLSLYQLSQEYTEALNFLSDPENDIDPICIKDTLEGLSGALDDKILNVSRFINSLELEAEAVEKIELRQRDRKQKLENTAHRLRAYLIENMQMTGHTKLKADDVEVKLAQLPASVQILDEKLIPPQFWKETVTRAISKADIKNAGGCPGTVIESKGYRVSIK
jgi:hypothetical protein